VKAIRVHQPGPADVLRWESVPDPVPGPGELLVRLDAIGVNFVEVYQRRGWYPQPVPFTPGGEGAGIVTRVGDGVTAFDPGARVASVAIRGSYGELALVPADRAIPVPDDITLREAAAALLQGMTAHYLATSTFPLRSGDVCLVHAAAGGVGLLLCQLATRQGAKVIGVVSSAEKAVRAREAGAAYVILSPKADVAHEVRQLTGGRGVNVVYDSVGAATFMASLDSLAPKGMLVLFGQSSGPVLPFDPQILNRKGSLFLTRPTLSDYIATREDLLSRANSIFGDLRHESLRLRLEREYHISAAAEAHQALESRTTSGKLLLVTDWQT
jgi:NADPH2:quinone reductase